MSANRRVFFRILNVALGCLIVVSTRGAPLVGTPPSVSAILPLLAATLAVLALIPSPRATEWLRSTDAVLAVYLALSLVALLVSTHSTERTASLPWLLALTGGAALAVVIGSPKPNRESRG